MKTKIKVVETFIEEQIKQLREEHCFGTANNYEKTMSGVLRHSRAVAILSTSLTLKAVVSTNSETIATMVNPFAPSQNKAKRIRFIDLFFLIILTIGRILMIDFADLLYLYNMDKTFVSYT